MWQILIPAWLAFLVAATTQAPAGEVLGRVAMPEFCAPEISPAVVILEPADRSSPPRAQVPKGPAEVTLMDQRGLQFVPRVQAMTLGQTLQFSNSDSETHSVHVVSPGFDFNQSMPAGQSRTWVPQKAGVVRLACDVHTHMRGFIVVAATPWVRTCTREGRFRFAGVPDGRYTLNVWHEMGEPLRRDVTVGGGTANDLGTLTLSGPPPSKTSIATAPVRPWSEVIDRISVILAASVDAAPRTGQFKKARRLAEDAYWGEFEASDMETAVRTRLGFERKSVLEDQFFAIIAGVREVAEGRQTAAHQAGLNRALLYALVLTARDLNSKGAIDGAHIGEGHPLVPATAAVTGDPRAQIHALSQGFAQVRTLADQGEPEDAASAMTQVYRSHFESLEQFVEARQPRGGRRLELQFNAIRGEVGAGLKGPALAMRLDGLRTVVDKLLRESAAQPSGTFGLAFTNSLITILREGVEVILLLTMLVALVAKTGQRGALKAIRWGVALAVIASAGTAWGLNRLVASTRGQARETVEGLVMLAAAGVLFYVSYWLISQSESKRWMDFLKRQARRGAELGGYGTLALTAFLAVYREGAETALMYQAMIGVQGHSRAGLIGLAAGLGVGLVLLAGIAFVIRATSVRLPLRAFFKVSGLVLFAMAVVFAGNGVSELQSSGILKITPSAWFAWLGDGVPVLGLYPTVQTLSVQGLLLAGAGLALVLLLSGNGAEVPARPSSIKESPLGSAPTAGLRA